MREEAMNMQYLMPGTYLTPFAFAANTRSARRLLGLSLLSREHRFFNIRYDTFGGKILVNYIFRLYFSFSIFFITVPFGIFRGNFTNLSIALNSLVQLKGLNSKSRIQNSGYCVDRKETRKRVNTFFPLIRIIILYR